MGRRGFPLERTLQFACAISGFLAAAFPRRVLRLAAQVTLAGYENPADLEPRPWYVSLTRVVGAVFAVAALLDVALDLATTGRGGGDAE